MLDENTVNTTAIAALAKYIAALSASADRTNYAEDRNLYQQRLAVAARMLAAIYSDQSLTTLRMLVAEERRAFGWSYLSGEPGEVTEHAFNEFATFVEQTA
jgi:hypothetical protein